MIELGEETFDGFDCLQASWSIYGRHLENIYISTPELEGLWTPSSNITDIVEIVMGDRYGDD